jgi:hypothetical protein
MPDLKIVAGQVFGRLTAIKVLAKRAMVRASPPKRVIFAAKRAADGLG